MKQLLTILSVAVCLLCACQTAETASPKTASGGGVDSAAIYQSKAYEAMFTDSLAQAEVYAYRAFMLSNDSTLECGSMALLCYIYYREGKQDQLQLLMQTVSPETYVNVMNVQLQVEQVKASRARRGYSIAIILLLLVSGIVCFWYIRRMRTLSSLYQQRIDSVRRELAESHESLSQQPDNTTGHPDSAPAIDETKAGVDVLYAIINDQNISQMGKQEEQAVLKTLPVVDAALAALLAKASSPLTPKETFFCIMEYYGKNDRQKARSFCCSEQAVRSTKSRLNKKIDIAILHSK